MESTDLQEPAAFDQLYVDPTIAPREQSATPLLTGSKSILSAPPWPYHTLENLKAEPLEAGPQDIPLIPYHTWGNRWPSSMRICIPTVERLRAADTAG